MKNKTEDIDFGEENFKSQFKTISRANRPNDVIDKSLRESKNRITIYLDAEIIKFFKDFSKESGDPYQTLINQALRRVITDKNLEVIKQNLAIGSEGDAVAEFAFSIQSIIKSSLLRDESFLNELATAIKK